MPRGGRFTAAQCAQIDFVMFRARQELNITDKHRKMPGPGASFAYMVACRKCEIADRFEYARDALRFLVEHLGHSGTNVKTLPRARTELEERNSSYPDKRRPLKRVSASDMDLGTRLVALLDELPDTNLGEAARALDVPAGELMTAHHRRLRWDGARPVLVPP